MLYLPLGGKRNFTSFPPTGFSATFLPMPELAEVDYYRKQWDPGLGGKIVRVHLHPDKRVFRGTDTTQLSQNLSGKRLRSSESRGKQMLFHFSGNCWLGLHLGMTGKLTTAAPTHTPSKHDHLVLSLTRRALIFNDMRQFGRVQFAQSPEPPPWWSQLPPDPTSPDFTRVRMDQFILRHGRLAIKPTLLLQDGFPGIGNWMADEILWRAGVAPRKPCAKLSSAERQRLFRETRFVTRAALARIGKDFSDPPKTWLIHERWTKHGVCPRHKTPLRRETIGARTTAWCPKCQK